MTEVIGQDGDLGYFQSRHVLTEKEESCLTALGALAGTAFFNAVFLFLNSREMAGVTHVPSLFESLSIYAFFFAVLWLSAGPLADAEHG